MNELTKKQTLYVSLLASGFSVKEIAEIIYVSPHTVRNTIAKAKERVNARNTNHLIAISIINRWVKLALKEKNTFEPA